MFNQEVIVIFMQINQSENVFQGDIFEFLYNFSCKSMKMDYLFLPMLVLCITLSCGSKLKKCSSVDECKCVELEDKTWAANCSNLNLFTFPRFQENVSVIYISNNSIQRVGRFSKLPGNLRELNISGNMLWYSGSSDLSFLNYVPKLEILDISNNVNRKSNMTYPSTYFRSLRKLTALYIDGLWGGDFSAKDWNLTSLANLTISGKSGSCYIDRLHEGFFSGIPNLRFLSVTGCRSLRSIDKGVFYSLTALHTLDLSFNEHLQFPPLQNVSHDLQYTNVQALRIRKLHCTFGIGTYLLRRDFIYFRNTSIKELDLSSNRIELMDRDVPKYFPSQLEILNMSDNQLDWGVYMLSYPFLRNLRIADVCCQHSYSFHRVDAYSCENSLDCKDLSSTSPNISTDRVGNSLKSFKMLKGKNVTFYVPSKVQIFYFHSSRFFFSIGEMHIGNNHIVEYHVQNNIMNSLDGPMYGMDYAHFVDFYGNFIRYVSPIFFDTFPNMTHLNLSNNLLGNCLNNSVELDHFRSLTKLIEIKLSNNGISSLPRKLLSKAVSLQKLDLSRNLISDFIFTLDDSCALQYLDLSSNRLRVLSLETIRRLENTHKRNNLSVDLSGNFFDCTCQTTFFLKWIRNSKINFVNKNAYLCHMSHKRKRRFINLNSILKELENECSSHLPKMIGITVSVMVIFIVGLAGALYKYRWSIRYFFFLTKWEIQNIVRLRKQKRQQNFEYSAFITYAEKESDFVETTLMHELEELNEMKLCLPNRDFSPNLRTSANITHAIHNSKKIICIITEDFLKDYWCMYKLQMAEEERIHRGEDDCIVFILFKPLSSQKFEGIQGSLFLISIIEQRSYALFPENETDRPTFWRKLIDTVQ